MSLEYQVSIYWAHNLSKSCGCLSMITWRLKGLGKGKKRAGWLKREMWGGVPLKRAKLGRVCNDALCSPARTSHRTIISASKIKRWKAQSEKRKRQQDESDRHSVITIIFAIRLRSDHRLFYVVNRFYPFYARVYRKGVNSFGVCPISQYRATHFLPVLLKNSFLPFKTE